MVDVEIILHITNFRKLKLGIQRMKKKMNYIGNTWVSEGMSGMWSLPGQNDADFQMMEFRITHKELSNQCIFIVFVPVPDKSMLKAEKEISLGIYSRFTIWWILSIFLKFSSLSFSPPSPAGNTLPNAPQDSISLFGPWGTLLAQGKLAVHQEPPPGPSPQSCFPAGQPSAGAGAGGYSFPTCRTLNLQLMNFRWLCGVKNQQDLEDGGSLRENDIKLLEGKSGCLWRQKKETFSRVSRFIKKDEHI